MQRITQRIRRRALEILALGLASLLAGCGGGGGDAGVSPPLSCSISSQKAWLRDYIDEWYFWYADSPRPNRCV